MAHIKT